MKQLLFLFCMISFNSLTAQQFREYSTDFALIGDVKKVVETEYVMLNYLSLSTENNDIKEPKVDLIKKFSFNIKSLLLTEDKIYNNTVLKCIYKYDKNDSLVNIDFNDGRSLRRRNEKFIDIYEKENMTFKGILKWEKVTSIPEENIYDSDGKLLVVHFKRKNYNKIKISKCKYSYENNNVKSITCYDDKDSLFSTSNFLYNSKGSISKHIYKILKKPETVSKKEYFFNDAGVIKKMYESSYEKGKVYYKKEAEYKNFKETNVFTNSIKDGVVQKVNKKYDTKGNLLSYNEERKLTDKGTIITKNRAYSYDKYNNILSEYKKSFVDSKMELYINNKFRYKYDKNGNWIVKCEDNHGSPRKLTVRKIDYHDSSISEISIKDAILFFDPDYFKNADQFNKSIKQFPVESNE